MEVFDAARLKTLEDENANFKHLMADAMLSKWRDTAINARRLLTTTNLPIRLGRTIASSPPIMLNYKTDVISSQMGAGNDDHD